MLATFRNRAAAFVFALSIAVPTLRAADKLNVLLIVSDDLRDTVGCYGNTQVKTPNIDRLAERGMRFDHAYVQYPVCNPSRTSFLTGLRSEQTHVVDNKTWFRTQLPEVVTWPQLLNDNGWHTASFGKVFHVGGAKSDERDRWMDLGKSWDEGHMFEATPAGKIVDGRNLTGGKLPWCEWGATTGDDDDQPDGQTALHSIQTIEKLTAGAQPWVVAAGFHRPHDPFVSPKKYFDLYPPGSLKMYHDPPDASPLQPLSLQQGGMLDAFKAFSDEDRSEFLRAYFAGVSFMDAQVGRLIDSMDRLKLWDNTLVIFIADHGYHHNERGWWNKNTLFERSCRVPMIVVAPGVKHGQVCESLVELVDLYPTVADYCGVKAPRELAGQSLRPLLDDPSRELKDAAYTLVSRGPKQYGQAVRSSRYRFIQWNDGKRELYDEVNDPQETHNLANDPAKHAVIDVHLKRLRRVGGFEAVSPGATRDRRAARRIDPQDKIVVENGIEYANPDGQHLQLNIARPDGAGPYPAVVCIHGGGFRAGERTAYDGLIKKLANNGYVGVTVTYRLAPKYQFPAAVNDVKAAVRWLRADASKYNIDPNRIGAMGGSAGGHLAQFLGVTADQKKFEGDGGNLDQSSRVACVVNFYGPSDFTKSYGKSVDAAEVLPLFLGGNLEQARERHIMASPLYWVTPSAAPTLCIHGTKDDYVAFEQAQWIVDRLKAAGVKAELLRMEGSGHGFKGEAAEKADAAMLSFFDAHLKKQPSKMSK